MNTTFFKAVKNVVLKNVLWIYTFLIILLKSIIFIGLTLDNLHTNVVFKLAYQIAWSRISFYGGFILLFLAFAFLLKNRSHVWYLLALNLVFSFLLLVDLWYFRGFNTMPTLHILRQGSNLNNLSDSILGMMHRNDLVFVFDIVLIFIYALLSKKIYSNMNRNIIMFTVLFVISACAVAYMPVKNMFASARDRKVIVYMYDSTVTCYNLSPIGYNVYSLYSFWKDTQTVDLTADKRKEINAWFDAKKENLPDNKYKGMFKGKNLIVMQIESLENFVINQKINGQEITPNLNKLLKNSIYFSDYHEQVNEGMSSDADLMANTSVYPIRQGSTFFRYPSTVYNSLPKLLQSKGYSTTAIHPDSGSFWNWRVGLTNIGFQNCIDASQFNQDETIGLGISDASYFKQAEPMILKEKQPFYTFIVTLTSHTPFNLPVYLRELSLDQKLDQTTLGGYLQSAHYTDKQIGIFLDKLQKDGILDNSVVVIYGDHEGIHKYFPDIVKNFQPTESWWVDNNKKIPLIIYQNKMQGEEIKTIGGQVDLLPTVSYLMGIDEKDYANTAIGRNLLNTKKNFAVLSDGTYLGDAADEKSKAEAVKGLDMADIIIRSNYFKK